MMTKNATEKRALFEQGVERHVAFKAAEIREVELARAQADARIREALEARNTFLAFLVDDEGFSVADVTRITNNKNWDTAKAAIASGRKLRQLTVPTSVDAEQPTGPYDWDAEAGELHVHMAQEDFEPYLAMLARHPSPDGEQWAFVLEGGKLLPLGHEDDITWEHPVVQVVMTDRGKRDALAYIESQTKAAA